MDCEVCLHPFRWPWPRSDEVETNTTLVNEDKLREQSLRLSRTRLSLFTVLRQGLDALIRLIEPVPAGLARVELKERVLIEMGHKLLHLVNVLFRGGA